MEPLTQREKQVMELVTLGLTDREVAATLRIATRTVHAHLGRIYPKLGVTNRTAAAAAAMRGER